MEFKDLVKSRRIALGLTLEEVGKIVGVSKATVQRWESGEISNMRRDKVLLLAKALHTTPAYLMGWEDDKEAQNSSKKSKGVKIPVLGRVVAGIPIDAVEEIIDYEEISEDMARQGDFFALQVKGDSMEPRIVDGDVVIVRKQEDVDSGDIAIVLVNGDEATIKKVQKFDGGINLVPTNSAYPVLTYTNKEIEQLPVRVIGKVVELRAKF
ncbi:MAG TPA: LexA family transcriptional regulator [Candidatus Scubalenecus merdavium]|uniref:LexA family transcriptional regulator n=1 Tax=Candidatus Scybalenecus merdavium TaxID=2840939 RepID=A0A9D1MVK2_9FIRM|nr:LexA family transcriptional regulator [Candidatus Scubalenecus merdavium]